jgi:hypothetical protein
MFKYYNDIEDACIYVNLDDEPSPETAMYYPHGGNVVIAEDKNSFTIDGKLYTPKLELANPLHPQIGHVIRIDHD